MRKSLDLENHFNDTGNLIFCVTPPKRPPRWLLQCHRVRWSNKVKIIFSCFQSHWCSLLFWVWRKNQILLAQIFATQSSLLMTFWATFCFKIWRNCRFPLIEAKRHQWLPFFFKKNYLVQVIKVHQTNRNNFFWKPKEVPNFESVPVQVNHNTVSSWKLLRIFSKLKGYYFALVWYPELFNFFWTIRSFSVPENWSIEAPGTS